MRSPVLDSALEIIFRELNGIINRDDFSEYSAKRNEGEKYTQTIFRTWNGEKFSRLVVEQYTVNSKAYGVVLNIYPKPEFGIPIMTFQLGGQIPDRVIYVLDIIPVVKKGSDPGISEMHKRHASGMSNLGSAQDWINEICSENALICQYKPLEPEKLLNALTDYLCYWRDRFYLPAQPGISGEEKAEAIENILKFKSLLHANDAGLEIYLKKFGKEMAAAIEAAAFGSEPSLQGNAVVEIEKPVQAEETEPQNGDIRWTNDALQYIQDAPRFVRGQIRSNAEKKALSMGIKEITRDFIEKLRK
ncbi:MAG: hypothetical protein WCR01_08345 [Bacteroidota bacterium]